jgi:predicted  nucleic acid-binding Zn-ribbon protein
MMFEAKSREYDKTNAELTSTKSKISEVEKNLANVRDELKKKSTALENADTLNAEILKSNDAYGK